MGWRMERQLGMNKGKIAAAGAIAALAAGLVATGSALCWTVGKVRAFDRTHGCDVFANMSPADIVMARAAATNAAPKAAEAAPAAPPATNATATVEAPKRMDVVGVDYDGNEKLRVYLSMRPDMDVVRHYVSVEPMAEGRLSLSYSTKYESAIGDFRPVLVVTGDYAHRTNVTLRIRRGLPPHGKGANPAAEGVLADDYVYTFRRKDRDPYVNFAAPGRYLPPGGARAVGLESVNVGKILATVCRVEPRNVVQLLAREEGAYSRYTWSGRADDEETAELAWQSEERKLECANRLNEKEVSPLSLRMGDGKPANGVFLVTAVNGDIPRKDHEWGRGGLNPLRCRLVCLSDLGLSVRKSGDDGLAVWVTSLLKGVPVGGAQVEVYSTANTLVMSGETDERGWCRPERVDKGDPFAVVVVSAAGDDMTFMALRSSMEVDETPPDGHREPYLAADEVSAFCWTDRGIYRHGETIMMHVIARNGARRAPRPMPVELRLLNPKGNVYSSANAVTDDEGAALCDKFSVADEQPSGTWTLQAKVPGEKGRVIGEREIRVEEFAPPQIRVAVEPQEATGLTNFAFAVSAEHLFGGPAHGLSCEGAIVFEDVPFAPANWKGWRFGNDDLGLRPCFRTLARGMLDRGGRATFAAPLWADAGLPKAAVRATAQGVVFEDGGRPATARRSKVMHYYPFYIGTTAPEWMKLERGVPPRVAVACVSPDGRRLAEPRCLSAQVERVDSVYSYRVRDDGWQTWDCDRVRSLVASNIVLTTATNENAVLELPIDKSGDYVLTIRDSATGASYARSFYLSDYCDSAVRAPLSDPTEVAIATDKAYYRVGESPRLTVKSPFAGFALVSVMRGGEVYSEVLNLTNATSEVVLRPVAADQAPNLDVSISVVQRAGANARHLAVRAHGQATVAVRPEENETHVSLEATVVDLRDVDVRITATNATVAVVTVVDEAINLLTGEETPDPVGWFATLRGGEHPLYDLYHRILPVLDDGGPRVSGVKTGGGCGAEMLGRVSPQPTRRFKPLALWSGRVPVVDGSGHAVIRIPEFVGEVRVTAVAYSASASGAASVRRKVTPKLVAMPDAPRFVAPGDVFEATLPVYNRSGADGKFGCSISTNGATAALVPVAHLAADGSTNVVVRLRAPAEPGEMEIGYHVRGMGEVHDRTILLPVRPAVAWVETAGVTPERDWTPPESGRWTARTFDSPLGELESALRWLADYPHGCLEQTSSRMFPLVCAGGLLNSVATNGADVVAAGVRRVESMVRANDFVMWPDCTCAPWDREVSLYAAHFLVEAERGGWKLGPEPRERVMGFLKKWAMSTNTAVSAYACHTLALAGTPERDRMLRLYDAAAGLSLLSRARLARAFARSHDRSRAEALLKNAASPASVKEAAFALVALLEIDDGDARILPLVEYLCSYRDKSKLSWGTTEENAHALFALGEYFRHRPPKKGERFVAWRKLSLPDIRDVRDESYGISVSRRFLDPEGGPADLGALRCGELLVAELTLTADDTRELNDLVVEDLFAGAFEPVHGALPASFAAETGTNEVASSAWVMRSDARDDRMLVFSKKFTLERGREAKFRYPVRVVSAGDYVLPGPSVEGMYHPALRARRIPGRIVVCH